MSLPSSMGDLYHVIVSCKRPILNRTGHAPFRFCQIVYFVCVLFLLHPVGNLPMISAMDKVKCVMQMGHATKDCGWTIGCVTLYSQSFS